MPLRLPFRWQCKIRGAGLVRLWCVNGALSGGGRIYRHLRQLEPDAELIRRRAAGETLRDISRDYAVWPRPSAALSHDRTSPSSSSEPSSSSMSSSRRPLAGRAEGRARSKPYSQAVEARLSSGQPLADRQPRQAVRRPYRGRPRASAASDGSASSSFAGPPGGRMRVGAALLRGEVHAELRRLPDAEARVADSNRERSSGRSPSVST